MKMWPGFLVTTSGQQAPAISKGKPRIYLTTPSGQLHGPFAGDNRFVNIDDLTTCASACPMKGAMTFLTPQRVTRSYSFSGPTASWSADGTTGAVELPCQ